MSYFSASNIVLHGGNYELINDNRHPSFKVRASIVVSIVNLAS
jgi:hypothetical protein